MTKPVRLPRTKGPFVKWLKKRRGIIDERICPLDAFLHDCGGSASAVGFGTYLVGDLSVRLPVWAEKVRKAADDIAAKSSKSGRGFNWRRRWRPSTALKALKGVL